jgi:hypothetical protein
MKSFKITIHMYTNDDKVKPQDIADTLDYELPFTYVVTSIDVEETENDHDR